VFSYLHQWGASVGVRSELLEATDDEVDDAVAHADPMVLRGLLHQLTGEAWVAATVVSPQEGIDPARLVDDADVERLRAGAAALLRRLRDGDPALDPLGPADRLPESLALAAGVDVVPPDDLELWLEELALDPFARGSAWRLDRPASGVDPFSVVVIGAGMGGLNAAIHLRRAGLDVTVVEKNSGVGGTWFENRYPGARVDSPSRAYTHILGVGFHPSHPFCPREENERYFNWLADEYDVRDLVVFDTEVVGLTWDDAAARWEVRAKGPDGERTWRPNVVVSAVGLLSRPSLPTIEGMGDFRGRAFHSSWWPDDLDVHDARVAVIGTGCSGVQLVPELAAQVRHLRVFQRTPQWLFDNPGYTAPYPPQVNWLDRNLPLYSNFLRFRTNWLLGPYLSEPKRLIDPDFEDPHARSAVNKRLRDERIAFIERKLAHRPDLLGRVIPPHPPFSARPVQVDREYCLYDALLEDHVTLVTDGIDRITERGIRTVDGVEHEVDVIVYATGFRSNECLWPMEVRGRGGQAVEDLWVADGPRAHLGTMLPGFPNLFMVYGPNMNPYGGLGVVNLEEMVVRYTLSCIEAMVGEGKRSVEPSEEAYRRWNDELDAREAHKIYRDPRARSYYTNEHGRSATNCPFTGTEMWHRLRRPDLDDLVLG
jgi:4-hydroxyacetophenone monooxygenase